MPPDSRHVRTQRRLQYGPRVNITIRGYRPGDAEATWRAFHEAIHRTAASYYSEEQMKAWAPGVMDAQGWNARRTQAWTVVADVDGEVAGFSDLTADGLLDMLFVHPEFGRRGVGRLLVEAVLKEAQRRGLNEVRTHASRAARPAFERLGFIVDHENEDNWIRGQKVPNFDMYVALAP